MLGKVPVTRIFSASLLVCLAAFTATTAWAHAEADHAGKLEAGACARYLGNEGVLIQQGSTKIIFDAFYNDSYGQYTLVPAQTRQALMQGEPPYDGISALFVSHVHGDHFSAAPTLAYLEAHPDVDFYASQQVMDALSANGAKRQDNWHSFELEVADAAQALDIGMLSVDVVRIPHAGWPQRAEVENLAFRVAINGGRTVLHLGDADPARSHFAPHQAHWDAKPLDLALPPYWFYASTEGAAILAEQLKAHRSIGIHVPEAAYGKGEQWRQEMQADLFTDPGEVRAIGAAGCVDDAD